MPSPPQRCLRAFLRGSTCYDLLLHSSKVVVFDVRIPIKLALYALVEHGINTAPLWDPFLHDYVGMITYVAPNPRLYAPFPCPQNRVVVIAIVLRLIVCVLIDPVVSTSNGCRPSDIVHVIRQSFSIPGTRRSTGGMKDQTFVRRSIASWRRERNSGRFGTTLSVAPFHRGCYESDSAPGKGCQVQQRGMIRAHPGHSLYDVCSSLCAHGIHHLPLVHPHPRRQTVLCVLTHLTILRQGIHFAFFFGSFPPSSSQS